MERILVSACLLGVCCRYDGAEKADERILKLLERDDIALIPVCPEQWGGMETPRLPCERRGELVVNREGGDKTACYEKGAGQVLKVAKLYQCRRAILKEKSPSCGKGRIYDGTFSRTLIDGNGVTAELLEQNGIQVIGENQVEEVFGGILKKSQE